MLLKETADDRDALDDTYEDWRTNVERVKKSLREGGLIVVDVELTVAEIEHYCQEHGLENNGGTRSQLVSEKVGTFSRLSVPVTTTRTVDTNS